VTPEREEIGEINFATEAELIAELADTHTSLKSTIPKCERCGTHPLETNRNKDSQLSIEQFASKLECVAAYCHKPSLRE
jgi:hypothetical protein